MPRIIFTPSGRRGEFNEGTTILQAARSLGVDLDSVCGGRGICGRCQIEVSSGNHTKHNIICDENSISTKSSVEYRYNEKRGLKTNRRLGCCATLQQDVVIDVPESSQMHRQIVRKSADERDIALDVATRLVFITVDEPDMHDPTGDFERVQKALKEQWNLDNITIDDILLIDLQKTLRQGIWEITIALHKENEIIALYAGFYDSVYGIAIDLGSTTIAAHLTDLTTGKVINSGGIMNPQIRFGEDLMSRVSYVQMNEGGEKDLTRAVQTALNDLILHIANEVKINTQSIVEAVIVGNPVMHHLFVGWNPVELGGAPFALVSDSALNLQARHYGLYNMAKGAKLYLLPLIAGHVGADAAAVALSEEPYNQTENVLIVDVGTNAEILLGNKDILYAASSPTGPAFEGAQISCGQRAAPGAIERIRIDKDTLEPKFKIIGCDLWSDENSFTEQSQKTGITGVCGSGIIEVIGEMFLAGLLSKDGIIKGNMSEKTSRIIAEGRTFKYLLYKGETELYITQNDIRAIQLAKAALYAGCKLLMDKMNIQKPDKIILAGAFGTHIDVKYALLLGLLPDCNLKNVRSAGNAAGTGARIALLNQSARKEIEKQVKKINKIETALEKAFQDHFVNAMGIPHTTDDYSMLKQVVEFPVEDISQNTRRRRRG